MKRKKILILVMGCDNEFFNSQFDNSVMNTYASNLPANVDIIYYYGNPWEQTKLIDQRHLRVQSPDTLEHTFMKTVLALEWCTKNRDFDFIVRANTSTYLNVPLISYFIENYATQDVMYGSDLYSLSEGFAPRPLDIFARGNCMAMSRHLVNILLAGSIQFLHLGKVDDAMIGNVLNYHFMSQGEDYLDHLCGMTHGWHKAVDIPVENGHQLSTYRSPKDESFYRSLMSCQVKSYIDRSLEAEHYKELHNIYSSIDYNESTLEECVRLQLDYMKNPSVFIGSLIGYIDLDAWKKTDKQALFNYEFSHKASDDAEHKKYVEYLEYKREKSDQIN